MEELDNPALVPEKVYANSVRAWTVTVDGDLVLLGGVAQDGLLSEAEVWIIKGPFFECHKRRTLKVMSELLRWVKSQFPVLVARAQGDDGRLLEFCGMHRVGVEDGFVRYEI